jgi:hypothetical protein
LLNPFVDLENFLLLEKKGKIDKKKDKEILIELDQFVSDQNVLDGS